jgi:hypothetical protein
MKFLPKYENILTKEFLEKEYVENNLGPYDIAKKVGTTAHTVYSYLKKNNITQVNKNKIDITGQQFYQLTAICPTGKTKNGTTIWECVCTCGKKTTVDIASLRIGKIKSCGCRLYRRDPIDYICRPKKHVLKKIHHNNDKINNNDIVSIKGNFFSHFRGGAKTRNIPFYLTKQDIKNMYIKQNGVCALSDLPMSFDSHNKTCSLDRKNSNGIYEINNCWLLHKDVNKMKASMSIQEFIDLCTLISNPIISTNMINKNNILIFSSFWKDIQYNAKKRHILFNVGQQEIIDLFIRQNGKCAITGQNIILPIMTKDYRQRIHTASLDRIDNHHGYVIENLQWVHKIVNQSRMDLNIHYYKYLANLVYKNNE